MLPNQFNPDSREHHQNSAGEIHQILEGRENMLPAVCTTPRAAVQTNPTAMMNNQHDQLMSSNQTPFLPSQGMVQGQYTQGPMLVNPYVEYQTHYFNTAAMTNQFVNYTPGNYHQTYNNTAPMDVYHQEYPIGGYSNVSMMSAQFMTYDISQDPACIAHYPAQPRYYGGPPPPQQHISAGQSPSDSQQINQGYLYDDAFPPEFVPRCNMQQSYELPKPCDAPPVTSLQPPVTSLQPPVTSLQPPVTSLQPPVTSLQPPVTSLQPPVTSLQPPVTSLQIQTVSNEADLLPAGLLSPSIESLTSDTDKSQCKEALVTKTPSLELPSLLLDKSTKPPSSLMNLSGYKIFVPRIHNMHGPRERQSEKDHNTTSNPSSNSSSGNQQGLTTQKSGAENAQKPTPLMDMSVEIPGNSKKSLPKLQKKIPLPPESNSLGARPKSLSRKPQKEDKYASVEEKDFFSLDAQRYHGGNSRNFNRRSHPLSHERSDNYTNKPGGSIYHAKEKSAGRQKLLAQTAALFNPAAHVQNSDDAVVEGQGVKAKVQNRKTESVQNAFGNQSRSQYHNDSANQPRKQASGHQQRHPQRGMGRHSSNYHGYEASASGSDFTQNQSGQQRRNNRGRRFENQYETTTGGSDSTQKRWNNRDMSRKSSYDNRPTGPGFSQSFDNMSLSRGRTSTQFEKTQDGTISKNSIHTPGLSKVIKQRSKDQDSNNSDDSSYATQADGSKVKLNQRERLQSQLRSGQYECMVCMERVLASQPIWYCNMCFHIFHQPCIHRWFNSVELEKGVGHGWRCPSCQVVSVGAPTEYFCFCGKIKYPDRNEYDPHSCGNSCGRYRSKDSQCIHPCTIACHPGPCPPCYASAYRKCPCGKIAAPILCGSPFVITCNGPCGKDLKCQRHKCSRTCHAGDCDECEQTITQACYCKKNTQELPCTSSANSNDSFSCEDTCGKPLSCGNHDCTSKCHSGNCKPCELLPNTWLTCQCGQTPLEGLLATPRASCTDKIPICQKICNKELGCGKGGKHRCLRLCHTGSCLPCPLDTRILCMCGGSNKEVPCEERNVPYKCTKKCNRKHTCHRHRCLTLCCTSDFHPCPNECKHTLNCGVHKCDRLCHVGNCPPCGVVSFDELHCRCGHSVIYPPVPCGTKPPECKQLCNRVHDCDHIPMHTCHSNDECPPCCTFTEKWCFGKHEVRKNVPCHQTEVSCGMACGTLLPCGRHSCIQTCHKDECVKEGDHCNQKCATPRSLCGHPCDAICHDGPCPDTPCMQMVKVVCPCKNIVMTRTCCTNTQEYKRMTTSVLASTMADLQQGHSVNISEKIISPKVWGDMIVLECNAECKIKERNKRMAIALQIRNPDLSQKLTPRFNENMRRWAKKDQKFVQMVHDSLTELVTLAKQSKQKSRSHSFPVMNREKRQFVHEYCEHFGCESVSYDEEPKRNVVATASKDGAWLPGMSLIEVIERESGMRKVPVPSTRSKSPTPSKKPVLAVTLTDTKRKTSSIGDSSYIQVAAKPSSSTVGDSSYIQVAAKPSSSTQVTATSSPSYIQMAGKPATLKGASLKHKD